MKRQAQSSHTLKKYSGGPGVKSQHNHQGGGSGFPNIEVQQKFEKIPTTFVFDKNIHPNDYKNYISIDDIYNENFEYARKLFEDPSRAFVVADYSSDHKIPRRLAQINYSSHETKRSKKADFTNEKGQMNSTVGGGNQFRRHEMSNALYPPPQSLGLKGYSQTKLKPQQGIPNTIQPLIQSNIKQNDDQVYFQNDLSPLKQQSQAPDFINENTISQQKNDPLHDMSHLQKSQIKSTTQIHDHHFTQGQPSVKDLLASQQSGQKTTLPTDPKRTFNQQTSLFQKKNSFNALASSIAPVKNTTNIPANNATHNNFTSQSMNQLPKEKKIQEDRVHGLIAQTREKVKKLQSYAEKLKRRVMQNDYGQNHKRNQKTIKKSQLVKNFIFNEDDFNKMLIQEDEDEKKNQINKKEKTKGFIERENISGLDQDSKKIPISYQSQMVEQYTNKKAFLNQNSAYQNQVEDDESDKSKEDLNEGSFDPLMKSDLKMKSSKHNFHKKMKLKKKHFEQKEVVLEAEQAHEKVLQKIDKFQKHWNNLGIMHEKINSLRAQSLQYARSGKILRTIGDKYGDLDLFQSSQTPKLQINNQQDLLNHLQALLTKPDATGDFKLHKQVLVHKNRIKNMRQNDVGLTNISNLSIEI